MKGTSVLQFLTAEQSMYVALLERALEFKCCPVYACIQLRDVD